jgi:hypothetical protein
MKLEEINKSKILFFYKSLGDNIRNDLVPNENGQRTESK